MKTDQSSSSSPFAGNFKFFRRDDGGGDDLGEFDQAAFLYSAGNDPSTLDEHKNSSRTRPTILNIFPSQPMHVEPSSKKSSKPSTNSAKTHDQTIKPMERRKDPPSDQHQKTLRRLAQNREAARKSRLRKKAYVQHLELSRMKLTQLEQELQRSKAQNVVLGGSALLGSDQGPPAFVNKIVNSEYATLFDIEYQRWLEEHDRLVYELRVAVENHVAENELRVVVESCLLHYDEMTNLKRMVAKSDVFHLLSGQWQTPAEKYFMWIGGIRPSELIKIIVGQVDQALSKQQIIGIYGLQQWSHEGEEALSQGLAALNQSLSEAIASESLSSLPTMADYMNQMATAMAKLSTYEAFLLQADDMRQQIIRRMHQILTTRQAAWCFLAISEYFHRLRALNALWFARATHHL